MELSNDKSAIRFLAAQLHKESLSLFLGAGMSKSFSLDGWRDLLNSICKDKHIEIEIISSSNPSAEELQNKADEIARKLDNDDNKLMDIVEKYLYKGLDLRRDFNVFQHHSLISVASLIMGSKRGRIRTVITLNYDSLLEFYLQSFGFTVNTISKLPYYQSGYDVNIFHPHGYLPHKIMKHKRSDEIILSQKQADNRVGAENSPWRLLMKHYLSKNVFLFIGLSEATASDRLISPILTNVQKEVNRNLGVWIFKDKVTKQTKDKLEDLGIGVLEKSSDEIPKFLMSISKEAMKMSLAVMK